LWSAADTNQMANRSINEITGNADDALWDLEQRLAGTGAIGGLAERATDIRANAGAAGAAARTASELGAKDQNAQYRLAQLAQTLQRRGQDIGLLTEGGRQGLQKYLGELGASTTTRGQDIDWLAEQLNALVTGRGQDVTMRRDDMDYSLGARGQDVQQRGQDADFRLGQRGQDVDYERAVLSALAQALGIEAGQRGDEVDYATSLNNIHSNDLWRLMATLQGLPGFAADSGERIY
jgi:hypothetical protein